MIWKRNLLQQHFLPWPRMWWCHLPAGQTTPTTTTYTLMSSTMPQGACGEWHDTFEIHSQWSIADVLICEALLGLISMNLKKKIAYHATIMQRSDPSIIIIIIIIIKMCLQLALTERCVLGTWAVGNRKLGRPWEIAVASLTPSWVTSSPALQRTTLMTR